MTDRAGHNNYATWRMRRLSEACPKLWHSRRSRKPVRRPVRPGIFHLEEPICSAIVAANATQRRESVMLCYTRTYQSVW